MDIFGRFSAFSVGKVLLEIEREKARQRQLATIPKQGDIGFQNVPQKIVEHGEALEIVARKVEIEKEKAKQRMSDAGKIGRDKQLGVGSIEHPPSEGKARDIVAVKNGKFFGIDQRQKPSKFIIFHHFAQFFTVAECDILGHFPRIGKIGNF